MNGVKYLLDTNFVLSMLKAIPTALQVISQKNMLAGECAYSAITRMELLGFAGITKQEEDLIAERLAHFSYLPITSAIEDCTISLRRAQKIKLPDAIIAATAIQEGLELLTFDLGLLSTMQSAFRPLVNR